MAGMYVCKFQNYFSSSNPIILLFSQHKIEALFLSVTQNHCSCFLLTFALIEFKHSVSL